MVALQVGVRANGRADRLQVDNLSVGGNGADSPFSSYHVKMNQDELHILQVGDVLVSPDIITEKFCCDLAKCKGKCCIEGDAGAPVTLEEIGAIEDSLDAVWPRMGASAQAVVDRQGVAYADREGDIVTSIVGGRDCVFTEYKDLTLDDGTVVRDCCLCALECAFREGMTAFVKPISCALYPIRVKEFGHGLTGINYHRWDICKDAVARGRAIGMPVYKFLAGPLKRRFGEAWYRELCEVAEEVLKQTAGA